MQNLSATRSELLARRSGISLAALINELEQRVTEARADFGEAVGSATRWHALLREKGQWW